MSYNRIVPIGNVIAFSRGGGWGKETPFDDSIRVAVIRGADFPNIESGRYDGLPIRFEKTSKVKSVSLRAGDIVLENSGGTDTRPTGRTIQISQDLLDSYDCPIIPASFCRIIRFSDEIDSTFIYYWLQDMFNAGRTWGYQNRSTGLANFQFKFFSELEMLPDLDMVTQKKISSFLEVLDAKIIANNQLNGYLAA